VSEAVLANALLTQLTGHDGECLGASVVLPAASADAPKVDRIAAQRFRSLYAATVLGLFCGDHDRITEANDQFLLAIGATREDLGGGLALGGVFTATGPTADPFVDGSPRDYEIRRLDGTTAHVFAAGFSVGGDAGWVGVALDLTQRKKVEKAIAHLALHDAVTGLPNRRLLLDRLHHALTRATRRSRLVGVLYCDVDRFKPINDTYGHRAGDVVLQGVARRLESVLRDDDTVSRVGGDEFVILLEDLADATGATRIAERARVAVSQPIALENGELQVSTSIGVAISRGPLDDVESLLRRADDAMYLAKQRGRDQIAFADDELAARSAPLLSAPPDADALVPVLGEPASGSLGDGFDA
jgi:diguanylate cyclase (GGDEF)-like protein